MIMTNMTNTKIEKAVEEIVNAICEKHGLCTLSEGGKRAETIYKALLTAHKQGKKARDKDMLEWVEGRKGDIDIDTGYDEALTDLKTFINEK